MGFKYDGFNHEVFKLIRPNTKILDVGCATGKLGKTLSENKKCECYGIDNDANSAKEAKKYNRKVIMLDLDNLNSKSKLTLSTKTFDYIVFADVLEHLKKPEKALDFFKKYLKDDGRIICSIPNIAHWRKRIMLLLGNWNYESVGICDETHLRFFSYRTARRLLENSGYRIERVRIVDDFKNTFIKKILYGLFFMPASKLFAMQFVFLAKRKTDDLSIRFKSQKQMGF